jgi:hypothetical protein
MIQLKGKCKKKKKKDRSFTIYMDSEEVGFTS